MIVNKELAVSDGHLMKDCWATPDKIFLPLQEEFGFTLDPCCTIETAKCHKFYTPEDNGLLQSWKGETVFCNPPYSRRNIDKWVEKCWTEHSLHKITIVALLPVSTSSTWFHKFVWGKSELRFYKGRIRFTAPFSSMLAIYRS